MNFGLYAIKDEKTGYMNVTTEVSHDVAMRNFAFAVNKKDSLLYSHSSDFSLWCLAKYNTETGEVSPERVLICNASSVKE